MILNQATPVRIRLGPQSTRFQRANSMSDLTLIFIIILITSAGFGLAIFFIKKETKRLGASRGEEQAFSLLKQDLEKIKEEIKESREKNILSLEKQLQESRNYAENQIKQSGQLVKDVTEKLTSLDATNKQIIGFAEQLQSLENILKNPKQRGNLGEYSLAMLLERSFTPKQFASQYEFKNGDKVDFALFIGDKILPIDSKFSLENYNRIINEKDQAKKEQLEKLFKQDLKNRIDETSKYIRPQENTFDFALMFIPAEGIYYDLMINEVGSIKANTRDLLEYAVFDKNVHIVSPNSFHAYLQTILQGLRAFQIEESAKEIKKNVEVLSRHLTAFDSYMQKMGNNLSTTVNAYNTAYKELGKIDKDVVKITEGKREIKPLGIDKPSID